MSVRCACWSQIWGPRPTWEFPPFPLSMERKTHCGKKKHSSGEGREKDSIGNQSRVLRTWEIRERESHKEVLGGARKKLQTWWRMAVEHGVWNWVTGQTSCSVNTTSVAIVWAGVNATRKERREREREEVDVQMEG